ncbi:S24 family peptidase [Paracidovorax wautersii]|uniref:S24 family peptidase n=1 Tax=Paracidovorax wautersii TaxID=1177982 RepID=UPI0031DEC857
MDDFDLQSYRKQRLLAAIDHLTGGNVAAFGRSVGYRDGAFVRQMLSGERAISEKTLRAVEALPGMSGWFSIPPANAPFHVAEQLATYRLPAADAQEQTVCIPIVHLELTSGSRDFIAVRSDAVGAEDASGVCFPLAWVQRRGLERKRLLAVRMPDDSMSPSLASGDVLTVDRACVQPQESLVYLVNDEGCCRVRRLARDKGSWWLVADNMHRYPRKELAPPVVLLLGQVIHVGSEVI